MQMMDATWALIGRHVQIRVMRISVMEEVGTKVYRVEA